ncbi:MAG: hypothetical protein K5669_04920 [Lachnospiraceae bacterium]|nr:hypothetical protein [Lachnospiraceae bacterium]
MANMGGTDMKEDIYKSMNNIGSGNIAVGAVMIVLGVAAGVLAIISGAKLLAKKDSLLF